MNQLTNSELVTKYLDYISVQRRLALRTQQIYHFHLQQLIKLLAQENLTILQANSSMFRYWLSQQHAKGYKPKALALMLSSWRSFYTWLGGEKLIEHNPLQDVRAPKSAQPLPKALSVDVAMQLTDSCSQQPTSELTSAQLWLHYRDSAMLELLYGCGLRVSELVSLDYQASKTSQSWLDISAGELTVCGKGNKQRCLPIGHKALLAIRNWLTVRLIITGTDTALFINQKGRRISRQIVWQRLRQIAQLAGLETTVHPHMLRHSFASHVLQSSGDLRAVQELLGHASISSTQIYTKLDFQHLAKIYDQAHPRAKIKS